MSTLGGAALARLGQGVQGPAALGAMSRECRGGWKRGSGPLRGETKPKRFKEEYKSLKERVPDQPTLDSPPSPGSTPHRGAIGSPRWSNQLEL